MKRTKFLAKILFLFFAVISLGLITVSCSDDDEEENYCDDCSTEIMLSNQKLHSNGAMEELKILIKNNKPILYYSSNGVVFHKHYYYVCNPNKIESLILKKAKRNKNGVKIKSVIGNTRILKENEVILHDNSLDSTQDIEIIEIEY